MGSETNAESKPLGQVFETEVTIRESQLDTFGHVNNAVYLQIFEQARWDIVTERGYGMKQVMERGIGPTILEISLKFRREIRNREKLTLRSWVTAFTGKTATMRQVLINAKGEEACIADFLFGLFDVRARKLIDPTPEWKKAIGLLND